MLVYGGSDQQLANLSYFAAVFLFQVPHKDKLCRTDKDCEKGAWNEQSHGAVPSLMCFRGVLLCCYIIILH